MENNYYIALKNGNGLIVTDIRTVTFMEGDLMMYDSEGSVMAGFKREEYKYFTKHKGETLDGIIQGDDY